MRPNSRRHQQVGRGGGERAGGGRQRAGQAVAGEGAGAVGVGDAARQHGMLQRHQHAGIAGLRIDGADERDQKNERDVRDIGEDDPGRHHQGGAGEQHVAQIMPRRDEPDRERQQRRAEQRRGRDNPDVDRREPERRQIGRQDDDGKAVAEAAHPARGVEQQQVGAKRRRRVEARCSGDHGAATVAH